MQVSLNDTAVKTDGGKVVYTSPALTAGKAYTLTVRASWADAGGPRSAEMPLRVAAGDNTAVDLNSIR
jgi:uncharacterized protein (TIGR03000 family)